MATILRDWSYRYPWLYQGIARTLALAVGGDRILRQLPLQNLGIDLEDRVLDLCCGRGEATRYLVQRSRHVTGLDASPNALARARQEVPEASYVEAFAQQMPFATASFDVVHTSLALHEFSAQGLVALLQEVHRILKPGGFFTAIDLHPPSRAWLWPGMAAFLWIFETETAWAWIRSDSMALLQQAGFAGCQRWLYAGGTLQRILARKGS